MFYDPQASFKAMISSHFNRQHFWVGIEKSETRIPIKKGLTSPSIKRIQLPLALAWVSTVHQV